MSFNLSFGIYLHDFESGHKIRQGFGALLDKTATGDGKKDLHDIGSASMEYENTKPRGAIGRKMRSGVAGIFSFQIF